MYRSLLILSGLVSLGLSSQAEDKPAGKDEKIESELTAARDKYRATADQARKRLLQAFADEDKRITDDPKLKLDDKLKRLDLLAIERKAYEVDGILPKSLSASVAAYHDTLKPARAICEKAFDAAANKYLATDREAAKSVLAMKAEFFKAATEERPRPFLHFAGRADTVELDKSRGALDLQKPFTIEMWTRWEIVDRGMFLAGDEAWPGMSDQISVTALSGWVLRTDKGKDGDKQRLEFNVASTTKGVRSWLAVTTPEQTVKPDQWQHIAVCRSATEMRIYWNGKPVVKKSLAGITLHNAPTNFYVGVRKNAFENRDFVGDVRDFRVSTKAYYGDPFTPKTSLTKDDSTLILLDFAGGDEKQIPDLSGEKRHGIVTGAKLVTTPK